MDRSLGFDDNRVAKFEERVDTVPHLLVVGFPNGGVLERILLGQGEPPFE